MAGNFTISNTGGAPLEISRFRISCSCAGVEVQENGQWRQLDKARLEPGDYLELTVRIAIGAPPGLSQNVSIWFATNDPEHERAVVEVAIPHVTSDVYTDPMASVFGMLRTGESAKCTITIYDCGNPGRRIGRVTSKHPHACEAKLLPVGTPLPHLDHPYAGQPIGQIEVVAHTEQPGTQTGELEIETVDAKSYVSRIPISGDVIGPIDIQPSALALPIFVSGKIENATTVRLVSRDGQPIIATLESVPAGLIAAISENGKPSVIISIGIREGASAGAGSPRTSAIRIRVQSPTASTILEVPICHP